MVKRKSIVRRNIIWILLISIVFTSAFSVDIKADTLAENTEFVEIEPTETTEETDTETERSELTQSVESGVITDPATEITDIPEASGISDIAETIEAVDDVAETTEKSNLPERTEKVAEEEQEKTQTEVTQPEEAEEQETSAEETTIEESEIKESVAEESEPAEQPAPTDKSGTEQEESGAEQEESATAESNEDAQSIETKDSPIQSRRSRQSQVTRYIYANSIIRNAPNGTPITTLKMPLFVKGTIEGAWLRFTYNGATAYVANSVTTTSNPPITGYAKCAVNVRSAPGGSVLGIIPKGYQVKGVLVGNMVRLTYNGRTAYVYVSLLQATPVQIKCYIYANSIIRNAPNGSVITKLWRPLLVSGTIEGAWLKFTYNGRNAYVAMSVTTTGNPAMTGYAKQKLYVRNVPNGTVIGTLALGRQVKGVLVGNMVRFTYNGKTGYVFASLLQKDPVKISGYASQTMSVRSYSNNSIIGTLFKGRPVSGQIVGNKVVFIYNGTKATVYLSLLSTSPVTYKGYVLANSKIYVKPNGVSYDKYLFTNDIQGIWEGNWLKTDNYGDTGYVYKSNIRDYKPSSYGVSYIASYGSAVTLEYKNALAEAKEYLEIFDWSKQRLYEQLVSPYGGKYSSEASQYAAENINANWRQNAVKAGRGYLELFNWSKQRLFEQLSSGYGEQFTQADAQYAVDVIFK